MRCPVSSPNVVSPNVGSPNVVSPNVYSPNVGSPNVDSPNIFKNCRLLQPPENVKLREGRGIGKDRWLKKTMRENMSVQNR